MGAQTTFELGVTIEDFFFVDSGIWSQVQRMPIEIQGAVTRGVAMMFFDMIAYIDSASDNTTLELLTARPTLSAVGSFLNSQSNEVTLICDVLDITLTMDRCPLTGRIRLCDVRWRVLN